MTIEIIDELIIVQERRKGDRRKKNSFVMYFDWQNHFELLSNEEFGCLMRVIYDYVQGKQITIELTDKLNMAFSFIKQQLERDATKYDNMCEQRKEWGRKGGISKAQKKIKEL